MTKVDIKALAKLARIDVSDEEAHTLEKEIPDILAFVEQVQKTAGEPGERQHAHRNIMREDADPHESGVYTEELLSAAPSVKGGRVRVKQVIKREK